MLHTLLPHSLYISKCHLCRRGTANPWLLCWFDMFARRYLLRWSRRLRRVRLHPRPPLRPSGRMSCPPAVHSLSCIVCSRRIHSIVRSCRCCSSPQAPCTLVLRLTGRHYWMQSRRSSSVPWIRIHDCKPMLVWTSQSHPSYSPRSFSWSTTLAHFHHAPNPLLLLRGHLPKFDLQLVYRYPTPRCKSAVKLACPRP